MQSNNSGKILFIAIFIAVINANIITFTNTLTAQNDLIVEQTQAIREQTETIKSLEIKEEVVVSSISK